MDENVGGVLEGDGGTGRSEAGEAKYKDRTLEDGRPIEISIVSVPRLVDSVLGSGEISGEGISFLGASFDSGSVCEILEDDGDDLLSSGDKDCSLSTLKSFVETLTAL